ncbi:hypothetical protein A3709_06020 [Halioglobus sp. HI00S01]|uniref:hypothetical protein n=1 Tax=Halioglobus sp. HI00S01 TaxID=1822214 RepID=UPI0007C31CF0|nr:hypothetical protein [Halioglobus sp. HI00S01]KZX55948.1 hypothetical protein A3709_06020 [Halioglobus sp. HI00S01]
MEEREQQGKRVVLWGGGSKAVSFLTRIEGSDSIEQVVDINPHKQGAFMPGTGQMVIAPADLRAAPPDTVIVANPVYEVEIGATLGSLGLSPELLCLDG